MCIRDSELAVIVSPDGSTPASLLQDTWFSIGKVEAGKKLGYHMHQAMQASDVYKRQPYTTVSYRM